MTIQLDLTDLHVGMVTGAIQEQRRARSTTAFTSQGAAYRQIRPTDKPTPAAARFKQLADRWNPVLEKVYADRPPVRTPPGRGPILESQPLPSFNKPPPPPPPLPPQLGPFIWNPITFNGFETHGWAQLTLYSNGGYNFTGSFNDPSAWDYDDSLAWGVVSSAGVLYTFSHTGSMHGWSDRWFEGGSDTDSWTNEGTNAAIQGGWADLCNGWRWQAEAGINFDIGGLINTVEGIIKAIETVVQVIAVVA